MLLCMWCGLAASLAGGVCMHASDLSSSSFFAREERDGGVGM